MVPGVGEQDTAWQVCETLRRLCQDAIEDAGRSITRSYVAAGFVSWDDPCGLLVAAPERVYRSEVFPTEYTGEEQCWGGFVTVNAVILLVRCVPTVDGQGREPPATEVEAAYRSLLEDAAVIWNALSGKLDVDDEWERAGLAQLWSGDNGGAVGCETRLTVGVPTTGFDTATIGNAWGD